MFTEFLIPSSDLKTRRRRLILTGHAKDSLMSGLHPLKRRLLAEELTRLRRADEQLRFATSQRFGRIDPNPHQIDAVVFALKRIPEGGCILADEVGLGKTIEAACMGKAL